MSIAPCLGFLTINDLVVEFIRAIGLYPTGTIVQLSTGEVAVVVEQNHLRRLKPEVLIVMDANKNVLTQPFVFDLAEDEVEKKRMISKAKPGVEIEPMVEIVSDLEPQSNGRMCPIHYPIP